jgi:hypothetical protein
MRTQPSPRECFGSSQPIALVLLLIVGVCGCASNSAGLTSNPEAASAPDDAVAGRIRADPLAYVRQVAARTENLEQYTLRLTRRERRGLLQQMHGPEVIQCWFRRDPFSVRMKWLDEDVKYGESTYVAGQEENKVRFVPRNGLFGLEPTLTKVNLQTPVVWGEARYPLTDFGLERLMQRTLKSIGDAGGRLVIVYEGLVRLSDDSRRAHHIRFEFPADQFRVPIQDLYVDPATDLPLGTVLKLPGGRIEAAYFYEQVDTSVRLTGEDFLLDAERAVAKNAARTD